MVDQTYLLALNPPSQAIQHVVAATAEVHGGSCFPERGEGNLAALFLMEIVRSWNVLPGKRAQRYSPLPCTPLPMDEPIRIVTVELDGEDGLLVTFSDGTTAGYVTEELLELRPFREPAESKRLWECERKS